MPALPSAFDPAVRSCLFEAVSRETLENDASVIYAVDKGLCLIYVNPAWDAFAHSNRGTNLVRDRLEATPVMPAIGSRLRPFYAELFDGVLGSGKPAEHLYQCSSPDLYRTFRMRLLPLPESCGVLTVHSIAEERPHSEAMAAADAGRYTAPDGVVTMCSHCRRTQRPGTEVWDWVPGFVMDQPAATSHGLCAICLDYYYLSGNARRGHK